MQSARFHLPIGDVGITGPAICLVLSGQGLQQLADDPRRRRLCVNILSEHQVGVGTQFAGRGRDKFSGISWYPGVNGAPTLDGTLASIEADVESEHDAGDHTIVIARVTGLRAHQESGPLLFYRGGFGGYSDFGGGRHG